MVSVTRADFLTILNGIATKGHSRAEAVTVGHLVRSQPLLDFQNNFRFREELVRAFSCVGFGELLRPFQSLLRCKGFLLSQGLASPRYIFLDACLMTTDAT